MTGHVHVWVTVCALCGVSSGNAGQSRHCDHPRWDTECAVCGEKSR